MKTVTLENSATLLKGNSVVAYGESDHSGPCDGYVARVTVENDQFFVNGLDINYILEQYDWVWLIEL